MNVVLKVIPYSLQPYAKAVTPAMLAVLAAVVGVVTGATDETAMRLALVGFVAASLAFVATNAPDGLARYAKALTPALLTVATVVVSWIVSGEWNAAEWQVAVAGLVASIGTALTPNDDGLEAAEPPNAWLDDDDEVPAPQDGLLDVTLDEPNGPTEVPVPTFTDPPNDDLAAHAIGARGPEDERA